MYSKICQGTTMCVLTLCRSIASIQTLSPLHRYPMLDSKKPYLICMDYMYYQLSTDHYGKLEWEGPCIPVIVPYFSSSLPQLY